MFHLVDTVSEEGNIIDHTVVSGQASAKMEDALRFIVRLCENMQSEIMCRCGNPAAHGKG